MLNKAIITGRLVKELELRKAGETSVVNFTIASNRPFKKEDGTYQADFITCVAWGKTAEFLVNYGIKGTLVTISGRIETRMYEKDGVNHYATEIRVDEVTDIEFKDKPVTIDFTGIENKLEHLKEIKNKEYKELAKSLTSKEEIKKVLEQINSKYDHIQKQLEREEELPF